MCYYHYTKGCHLRSIVKDGMINTTDILCEKKQKPAVWLTKSPEWEVACNAGIVLNREELAGRQSYYLDEMDLIDAGVEYMRKEIGMCRILISEKLPVITWAKYKHVSGVSSEMYNALDSHSKNKGCPVDQWYCRFSGIPRKYWQGIEMFVEDQWVRWDEKTCIEEFVALCLSCNQ